MTPADFSTAQAQTGYGSIHVDPLSASTAAAKFILRYVPGTTLPLDDFDSFSIDFLMEGDPAKFNQFYINFYALTPDPDDGTHWFDCRYDYIAGSGSTVAWTTLGFSAATPATAVDDRVAGACGSSPSTLPPGSTLLFISVNLGDTSAGDAGVGGYFDNALLSVGGSTTTFDFEFNEDACKQGGWKNIGGGVFENQGACVSYIASDGKSGGQ